MAHIDTVGRPVSWWERVKKFEPALLRAVVLAVVGVLGLWGLDLTEWGDRLVNSWTLLFPVLFLLQGWWTRSVVVPQANVIEQVTPEGLVLAGPASPVETGTVLRHVDDNTTME
jgi:hypothetical protein